MNFICLLLKKKIIIFSQIQVSPCLPNPCNNFGVCSSPDGNTFKCTCSPSKFWMNILAKIKKKIYINSITTYIFKDFTGQRCEVPFNSPTNPDTNNDNMNNNNNNNNMNNAQVGSCGSVGSCLNGGTCAQINPYNPSAGSYCSCPNGKSNFITSNKLQTYFFFFSIKYRIV